MKPSADSPATVEVALHGDPAKPTLIYCPGLHGDWTLLTSFRVAATNRFRLVEITYPRTTTWSLDDYAAAIETALLGRGITEGWLLGESFGSQVVWALLARAQAPAAGLAPQAPRFRPLGAVLAGGFVRHPVTPGVRLMRRAVLALPDWCARASLKAYEEYARFRHRQAPETLAHIREFTRRRQERADRLAVAHRLALIAAHDPRPIAATTRLPVFALSGLVDPLVPIPPVRRWLRRHCPGFRGARTILNADHNVLATAPRQAAEQIERWITAAGAAPGR